MSRQSLNEGCQLYVPAVLTQPKKYSWYLFLLEGEQIPRDSAVVKMKAIENLSDNIGNHTRDLPAVSAVCQPTVPQPNVLHNCWPPIRYMLHIPHQLPSIEICLQNFLKNQVFSILIFFEESTLADIVTDFTTLGFQVTTELDLRMTYEIGLFGFCGDFVSVEQRVNTLLPVISSPISYTSPTTESLVNPLAPNDVYICRTAQLISRRCILNIQSTNILTE